MKNKKTRVARGFTLIELLIVIAILAILAAAAIVAINPARQFAQARNAQRLAAVNAILDAIGQNMADNRGVFYCPSNPIASGAGASSSFAISEGITDCIVPTYLSSIPSDPLATGVNTGYEAKLNTAGRVVVCSTLAHTETALGTSSPELCVTR